MERIAIEVDATTAKMWQEVSSETKARLEKSFQSLIEIFSHEIEVAHFESLLDGAGDEAARNGLTEEILQQLLNEE